MAIVTSSMRIYGVLKGTPQYKNKKESKKII
jgi:hypothetical protein